MFLLIQLWFLSVSGAISIDRDDVSERLTLQPLANGDYLFVLDIFVTSRNTQVDQGYLTAVLPIDILKLHRKVGADWFVSTQGFGEWKYRHWGDSNFDVINPGLTLLSKWSTGDREYAYDKFESLCYGLWGLTGSPFTNLVNGKTFVHDLNNVISYPYEVIPTKVPRLNDDGVDMDGSASSRGSSTRQYTSSNTSNSTIYMSNDDDDILCVDNLYKWHFLLPCLSRRGLSMILNDERLFTRSYYRGIKMHLEESESTLNFEVQIQFTVTKSRMLQDFCDYFVKGKCIADCKVMASSYVDFVIPVVDKEKISHSCKGKIVSFKSSQKDDILNFYKLLLDETNKYSPDPDYIGKSQSREESDVLNGITASDGGGEISHPTGPLHITGVPEGQIKEVALKGRELFYEVAELDSLYCDVLKRVQSSLFITIENLTQSDKLLTLQQPLPYWLYPMAHTLRINIKSSDNKDFFSCTSLECFGVNRGIVEKSEHSPFIIYHVGSNWNVMGFKLNLPPKSKINLRVELLKDFILFDDIHPSTHRGQRIPPTLIIDQALGHTNITNWNSFEVQLKTLVIPSIYSHVVLPDDTMVFNVMAGVAVVSALIFGSVINTLMRNWDAHLRLNVKV